MDGVRGRRVVMRWQTLPMRIARIARIVWIYADYTDCTWFYTENNVQSLKIETKHWSIIVVYLQSNYMHML